MEENIIPDECVQDNTYTTDDARLAALVEALLFSLGGAHSRKELQECLSVDFEILERAVGYLLATNESRGIVLVDSGDMLELRASPIAGDIIEQARLEEYNRDIGRAGLEVLAIVLYQGAQSRAQIDFIRGVNSTQTIRTLTMRGLVRKISNPKDDRQFLYEPTTELLAHLGITNRESVPEYDTVRAQLEALISAERSDG